MILKIFSVLDSRVATFSAPFHHQREASAIRDFSDAVNDASNPNNMWHKHPEDFSLYQVGEFNSETGEIIPVNPKNLVTASALKSAISEAPPNEK